MVFEAPGPSNVHILGFRPSETPPKFNEKTPRERQKAKTVAGEGKKRAKFWAVRRGVVQCNGVRCRGVRKGGPAPTAATTWPRRNLPLSQQLHTATKPWPIIFERTSTWSLALHQRGPTGRAETNIHESVMRPDHCRQVMRRSILRQVVQSLQPTDVACGSSPTRQPNWRRGSKSTSDGTP